MRISPSRITMSLALCLALGSGPGVLAQEDLKDLARRAKGSVVLLEVLGNGGRTLGTGTGFFIDAETLVTNHHVISSAPRVRARFDDGTVLPVEQVLAEDAQSDLALLHLPAAPTTAVPLTLYSGPRVEPGEEVVVLGNPAGLSGTLSTGIVSAWRTDMEKLALSGIPLIQITAPISPGSSGSPVMNRAGEVLGVAVAVHRTGQNLNFAVPVDEIRRLAARIGPEPARRLAAGASAVPWVRNLLLSLAVFGGLVFFIRRL